MTQHITLLAFDECLASAVIGAKDLFGAANVIAAQLDAGAAIPFQTHIASPDGSPVRAASGYCIRPDGALADAPPAQAIMVPGITLIERGALVRECDRLRPLAGWLRLQHQGGSWIAASCSGSFLLAETGLLDGRHATTTNWFADLFAERYPAVRLDRDVPLTAVDRLACGGGAFSYIDLALYLIEQLASRELARACARYVVMDNRRGAKAPELIRHHARTYDPLVTKADQWIRANLDRDIRVQDVANQVAVSMRTLMRRFKDSTGESPQGYLQRLRLETAKTLLANSRLQLGQILDRIGYHDDSAFRRLFKRRTSLSPREYRERFGRA